MFKKLMNAAKILFAAVVFMGSSLVAVTAEQEKASIATSDAWLKMIDQKQYNESLNASSPILQLQYMRGGWPEYLNLVRGSLGNVSQRTFMGAASGQNPANLPPGDYEIVQYKTTFSGSSQPYDELVFLVLGNEGYWLPVLYLVAQHKD